MSFDFSAQILTQEIGEGWEPEIKAQHEENRRRTVESLVYRFGAADANRKINDFIALDVAPISVLSVHNALLDEIRDAFTFGSYYPALVGAGALGERILNELVLRMRDKYFAGHASSAPVRGRKSVDNWSKMITALRGWGVISISVAADFNTLGALRNRAVHFGIPNLHETGARAEALAAIHSLQAIISSLFSAIGDSDLFIPGTAGVYFISRNAEDRPLFQEFYLPACVLVSPQHRYENYAMPNMAVVDNSEFESDTGLSTLTDAEFVRWNA